jgi:glycerol kinase
MSAGLILSIDQGTTNTKALLIDPTGNPVFRISEPVALIVSSEGFVEQDAEALWASVCVAIRESAAFAARSDRHIQAIAITNQRESAVSWSRETGRPLANVVSWQCGRGTDICNRLAMYSDSIRWKTGLPLAALISASKWAWLLENNSAVRSAALAGDLRLGTVDAWLISQLTGGKVHATDLTNASRTGLLNLTTLQWDSELLELFGIPYSALPSLHDSSGVFGLCCEIAELEGVPILSVIGDSHAAMFGHGNYSPGSIKATYGTGSSLMALTSSLAADTSSLARTIAWSIGGRTQFALEGNIAMTGSAVQWIGEFLNLSDPATGASTLAATVPDSAGVYFVPAMGGLCAPHWDAEARGSISGLARVHTAAHLARAAVDAIAYQIADVFFAMEKAASMKFTELCVDGGATRNEFLMQFQADILGCLVLRSKDEELSAVGAAWLAGLALGWWKSPVELSSASQPHEQFTPQISSVLRDSLYAGWNDAVANVCTHLKASR